MSDLLNLVQRHKPAKHAHYWQCYEPFLAPRRESATCVLEIGVGGGGSLRVWQDYFPQARIIGVDINPAKCFEDDRITVLCGDQGDLGFLESLKELGPFDVIVDDGSHRVSDQLVSLDVLSECLKPQGVYGIEDLHTSYWPAFGGGRDTANTVEFVMHRVHGLNYSYWRDTDDTTPLGTLFRRHNPGNTDYVKAEPTWWDLNIGSIHFYESLCILIRR